MRLSLVYKAGLPVFLGGLFPVFAFGGSALDTWLEFIAKPAQIPPSITERARLDQTEWDLRDGAAKELAQRYFAGENLTLIWKRLEGVKQRESLLQNLGDQFMRRSLADFRQFRHPAFRFFLEKVNQDSVLFGLAFRPPVENAPEKGGFHRGSGSIYMNLDKVPTAEWRLIFLHELLHGMDDQLKEALPVYNDKGFVTELARWADSKNWKDLTENERARLDAWLLAGLDRGLLAEHRAWVTALLLYQIGRDQFGWAEIRWVEDLVRQKPRKESISAFLFRFLDARFEDPKNGIFARPLVQKRLKKVRESIRRKLPPLRGTLEEIRRLAET